MLIGRQLYLLRKNNKKISDEKLSELLGISINDILIYEYGYKKIPKNLYEKWKKIIT